MKTWVLIAISTIIGFVLGVVVAIPFIPIQVVFTSRSECVPAVSQTVVIEEPPAKKHEEVFKPMDKEDWKAFEGRWAHAPETIKELARLIADGGKPETETLDAIGATALSYGYPVPELDFERNGQKITYLSTLLQEAVLAYNLGATRALLAAGADPDVYNGEVLFLAVEQKTHGAPNIMLFPDHDEMLPFLRLYLEAGADVNARRYGFLPRTPLSLTGLLDNLGAMLMLLEFEADPWLRFEVRPDIYRRSLMLTLASGSLNSATGEVLFRIARAKHLPQGSDAAEQEVLKKLEDVVEMIEAGTGPQARHGAWRMDQLLYVMGNALERREQFNALRKRLPAFDYQADGGWNLAEDEVHSRYDAPLSFPDGGPEIWGP